MASEFDSMAEAADDVIFDEFGQTVWFTHAGGLAVETVAAVNPVDTERVYDDSGDNQVKTIKALIKIGGDTGIISVEKGDILTIDGENWYIEDLQGQTVWAVTATAAREVRKSKHHRQHIVD